MLSQNTILGIIFLLLVYMVVRLVMVRRSQRRARAGKRGFSDWRSRQSWTDGGPTPPPLLDGYSDPCSACSDLGKKCQHGDVSYLATAGYVRVDTEEQLAHLFSVWKSDTELLVLCPRMTRQPLRIPLA